MNNANQMTWVKQQFRDYGIVIPEYMRKWKAKNRPLRIIIAGSRGIDQLTQEQYERFFHVMEHEILGELAIDKSSDVEIISGRCRGMDRVGELFARYCGSNILPYVPAWDDVTGIENPPLNSFNKPYNPKAGFLRNTAMAMDGDILVVSILNGSNGSKHMVSQMEALGKPVIQLTPFEWEFFYPEPKNSDKDTSVYQDDDVPYISHEKTALTDKFRDMADSCLIEDDDDV